MLILGCFAFFSVQGQDNKPKVIKEVDQVNKKTEEVNETSKNTNDAIKSTVENSKETIKTIGSLFGSGKKKGAKSKGGVVIDVQQVAYDDEHLNRLYAHISSVKGVKKASKNFSGGTASISISSKENADALWQTVPENVRNAFKMVEMNDRSMLLQMADIKLEE